MSATLSDARVEGGTATRLLRGVDDGAPDPGLRVHLERWGELRHRPAGVILEQLEASRLAGHGGGWFPVSTKWRAVGASSRRSPVVVANGAESEPASRKDALLLRSAPHLVLDGLAVAANTLRARRAVVYAPPASIPAVEDAIDERRGARLDPLAIEVVEAPDRFLAGQESAVVNVLNGTRRGLPSFVGVQSVRDRGVEGRPTLVQNVETLAHVALIARYGAQWFKGVGTHEWPGTMLLTLTRPDGPLVLEAALGSSLADALGLTAQDRRRYQGALLGGYGGAWISMPELADLPVLEKAARAAGATLGAGVVVPLPQGVCPIAEMADVVNYMEAQGAGQCGPCVNGLARLRDAMNDLACGAVRGDRHVQRILGTCDLVEGRGACRHPDGVARFVRSGLRVFADEVASHLRHGPCTRTASARVLPVPNRLSTRRAVRRA